MVQTVAGFLKTRINKIYNIVRLYWICVVFATWKRIQTVKIKNKKRVYFESIHSKIKTFSSTSIPIFVLETAGGINIAKYAKAVRHSNIADYGKERLLSKAKEIDVFLSQYGKMNRVSVEQIKKESGFKIIKAIKNNKVFLVEEQITSRPTIRLLLGIYEIGHILYPKYYTPKIKNKIKKIISKYYKETK